jgi:hypothetical protein
MTVHLILQRFPSLFHSSLGVICLGLWGIGITPTLAHGRVTDVLVSVVKDQVIVVTGVGHASIDLSVGETVRSIKFRVTRRFSVYERISCNCTERVQGVEHTGDAEPIKTSRRTLMFRSRTAGWTDVSEGQQRISCWLTLAGASAIATITPH